LGRGRRRSRYDQEGPSRATVALFVGAIVLLLASGGLIAAMLRQGTALQAASPTPVRTTILAAASPHPTETAPATATTPPPTAVPATVTGTPRPPTVTAIRPATATAAATARPASPTPIPATTRAGGCALAIPSGFAEERTGSGYYPANDKTGFIALDPFDTNGGQRSTADLAQGYIDGTLKLALQDFRQTASIRTDDGSRIEYTASAGGKTGRGVVVVRRIGDIACGVTLFTLEGSPIPFDQTLDYLLSSLQPTRP
jgi:hypothetical protein